MHPKTGIAVKASAISALVIMICAFFMELEQIARVISCSNLLTYSFVSACGIAMRYKNDELATQIKIKPEVFVWLYVISSFTLAILFMN